jgi:hypothetical protein
MQILNFVNIKQDLTNVICNGGLANESLFAIILYYYKQFDKLNESVIKSVTHIADWSRMETSTSPHLFKNADEKDLKFIDLSIEQNKYVIFIRKIAPEFPNDILKHYIYEKNKDNDNILILREPIIFTYIKIKKYLFIFSLIFIFLCYNIYKIL